MDARTVLTTFAGNFPGFQTGLILVSTCVGLMLVASSVYGFATYHRRARNGESMAAPLWRGMSGAVVMGLGAIMSVQTRTLLESGDARSILDYQQPTGSEAAILVQVLLGLMALFGWIGVFKGWLILSRMGKSQGGHRDGDGWNAFVFLTAGTIAANLQAFSDVIAGTFGVENYLARLLG